MPPSETYELLLERLEWSNIARAGDAFFG